MRVLLLDPGLLNRHGHHFHVDLAIHEACAARGVGLTAVGHRRVEPEIRAAMPVRPLFRAPAYPSRDGSRRRSLQRDFEVLNRLVAHDLQRGLAEPLAADDLILVPTARNIHLSGVLTWYERLRPRPRVCLRLLFEPEFRVEPEEEEMARELTRRQMRSWARIAGGCLTLAAERRELADLYAGYASAAVHLLPMPIRYPGQPSGAGARATDAARHVVFVGEARREKGFELLPGVCRQVLAARPTTRFTLQASCLFDVAPATLGELRALAPAVSLVDRPLTVDEYGELMRSADLVLAPYDPAKYRYRTSQIFLEAVGSGTPVVTTRGTWMHEQLVELGADAVIAEAFSVDGVAGAIRRALDRWPETTAAAAEAGRSSRRRHNAGEFLAALLACADEAAA